MKKLPFLMDIDLVTYPCDNLHSLYLIRYDKHVCFVNSKAKSSNVKKYCLVFW